MQNNNEKENTSAAGVIPAVAKFLGRYDKEDFTENPGVFQEMFNDLMRTAHGDGVDRRERMLYALDIIQDFADTVYPFSQEVINEAVRPYEHE